MATPTVASGTSTPLELDPEQLAHSLKVSLADLSAKAAAHYAKKNYDDAAEVYAQAAQMQAEMNGEMSLDNADILFLYGRALFKVGQSKSDVLGGRAPDTAKPKAKSAATKQDPNGGGSSTRAAGEPSADKKAMFHFEGDENLVESDDDDDDEMGEGGDDDEEEEDDLAMAFEILDLARVLFTKKLAAATAEAQSEPTAQTEETEEPEGKGTERKEQQEENDQAQKREQPQPEAGDSPTVKHIKERLADTHDLLAEISLENERYPNAITDSRASLMYKKELYPQESEIIAEAHFKLSLALEFASVTKSSDDNEDKANAAGGSDNANSNNSNTVDQALRDEAAVELEAAIASTKLKLQAKEVELATLHNPDDNDIIRSTIADVKDVIADMEQRLVDLRKPPIDVNAALGLPQRSGAAAAAANDAIAEPVSEEVRNSANDLSGLVRKKRKAEDKPEAAEGEGEVEAKKAKEEPAAGADVATN